MYYTERRIRKRFIAGSAAYICAAVPGSCKGPGRGAGRALAGLLVPCCPVGGPVPAAGRKTPAK